MKVYAFSLNGNLVNFNELRDSSHSSSDMNVQCALHCCPYGCGVVLLSSIQKHRLHSFCFNPQGAKGKKYLNTMSFPSASGRQVFIYYKRLEQ